MIYAFKRANIYAMAESTPGTAISDAALFVAANLLVQSEGGVFDTKPKTTKRQPDGYSTQTIASVVGQLPSTMKFKHSAFASGTAGTAPSYGPFLKGCYASETVVASTSVTYAHSDNQQTFLTLGVEYMSEDGTAVYRHVMKGARGNAKLTAGEIGAPFMWEEEFTGAYAVGQGTTTTPVSSITFPNEVANGIKFGQFQSPSGIFLRQCDSFELDFGIKPDMATDTVDASGLLYATLGGPSEPTLKLGWRVVPKATHDDYADFIAGTLLGASAVTFGTTPGKILTVGIGASAQFDGSFAFKKIGAAAGIEATIGLHRDVTSVTSNTWSLSLT